MKTMSLKNVKNMGTEGRRNGVSEVAPSENILGMVKFKIELIKEFNIVPDEIQKPEEDPAILESVEATEDEKRVGKEKETGEPWARGTRVNKTQKTEDGEENEQQQKPKSTYKPAAGGAYHRPNGGLRAYADD